MMLRLASITLTMITALAAGSSAILAQDDPAACSGTVSFHAKKLDEHGAPTGFTHTELECEGKEECRHVSEIGPHGAHRRRWCGTPGEAEPAGCRVVVRSSTQSGGGPAIAFCAGTCEEGPCRPHVAELEEKGSGIHGKLSCECGGGDEQDGEGEQPEGQPPGQDEKGDDGEKEREGTEEEGGAGGAGAPRGDKAAGRGKPPAPEVDVGDKQMSLEEASKRVRNIKEKLDELRNRLEKEGVDTRFLDNFEDELEEMQKEWEGAETVPRSVLDRVKKRLKGRMAKQTHPDGSRVFEDEEIEEYVDETLGATAGEGEEGEATKEAQESAPDKPELGEHSGSSRQVPPGDAPAPEVEDLVELGTLAPGVYDLPITAANTSCRGEHTFRIVFEPARGTEERWLVVVGPRSLEGIAMKEEKTTQAKVDLREVPPGTLLEGVLRIECITCPPPPVCTQNRRAVLVRAEVAE